MVSVQSSLGLGDALSFASFVVLAVVVFAFADAVVYPEHRKEIVLTKRGHYDEGDRDSRARVLDSGLLVFAIGLGSVVPAFLSGGAVGNDVTAVFVDLAILTYCFYKCHTVGITVA